MNTKLYILSGLLIAMTGVLKADHYYNTGVLGPRYNQMNSQMPTESRFDTQSPEATTTTGTTSTTDVVTGKGFDAKASVVNPTILSRTPNSGPYSSGF